MPRLNLLDLRNPVEKVIDAYRRTRSEGEFATAWETLVRFWGVAGDADLDEGGDPDYDGAHYALCRRFVDTFEHVGFDASTEDGEDYLKTAAEDVLSYLNEGNEEQDILTQGEEGELECGDYLTVNLWEAKVVVGGTSWKPKLLKAELKIGRNTPCPCGSGKKHKKCCLGRS